MAIKRRRQSRKLMGSGDYKFGPYTYKGDTPFAGVGKHLGRMIGWPQVGEGVGHIVGRLFGSGDYKMGPKPSHNTLWNSTQTPKFASKGRSNCITNREYLGDVITGAGGLFNNQQYSVNPGNLQTFPWLSTVAQQYEQYKITGIIFEFKSTSGESVASTNTAIGTVIMGTEYNVNAKPFPNKQYMENAEFTESCKASENMIHGLECAKSETTQNIYYNRSGTIAANDNLKWYDFANFQIATQGFQADNVNIGELWVSYNVEFFKPQIPSQIGGATPTLHLKRINADPTNTFGLPSTPPTGNIEHVVNGQFLTLFGLPLGSQYMLVITYTTVTGAAAYVNTITLNGATLGPVTYDTGNGTNIIVGDESPTSSKIASLFTFTTVKNIPALTVPQVSIKLFQSKAATNVSVFILQMDNSVTT